MRFCIFYFSGTGATAKLADEILKGFRKRGHQGISVRLKKKPPNQKMNLDLQKYDILGFGAPVYAMRAPRLATKLIENLKIPKKKAFFTFTTAHGDWGVGNTHWNLYKEPAKNEGICLGTFKAYGTNNIRWWRPKYTKKKPKNDGLKQEYLDTLDFHIDQILKNHQTMVQEKTKEKIVIRPNPFWSLWSLLFTARWEMWLTIGKKHVKKDDCIHCGLCETDICPAMAISLDEKGLPEFDESKCVACYGCINLCPKNAIYSNLSKGRYAYNTYSKYIMNSKIN